MDYDSGILLNYSYTLSFEREHSYYDTRIWMVKNWKFTYLFSAIYVITIFSIQYLMKNRPKFVLRELLILWNFALASFSIIGFCRTIPEFVHVYYNYGFYHTICTPTFVEKDRICSFWSWLFILSKLPELGDTIFIVLRKQPLIFLHWYHHITVLIYGWFTYADPVPSGSFRWFMVMNFFVHAVMYSYYMLKAAKFKVPRFIPIIITTLQILQMIIGCSINIVSYNYLGEYGLEKCKVSFNNYRASTFIYFTYFLLFSKFFYKAYIKPLQTKKVQYKKDKNGSLPTLKEEEQSNGKIKDL